MSIRSAVVPVVTLGFAGLLLYMVSGKWTSWRGSATDQRTDDAYVRAEMTPLSTRISGMVQKVNVGDFEMVRAGQLLVQLKDDDYRAALEEAHAALAGAHAEFENNQASKRIQDSRIHTAEIGVAQAASAVSAARAGIATTLPDVERTGTERKRQESLFASKAATRQQLEQAVADTDRFSGMLASRQADLERSLAALESSRALLESEKRQREALDTRDNSYNAVIQARRAAIVVAQVNLGYTRIVSPIDGAVGERRVQEGQLVTPGKQVVDVVNENIWIQANYKETQLTNTHKGDAADIEIDTFPGVVLRGKVAEIAPASGSQFALLPPDNATGNFTKVVQRVPVKIVLDPGQPLEGRLRPGFSVVATIHASGKHTKAVGSRP